MAGHQVVHVPPVNLASHKQSIQVYIDHLQATMNQRKAKAVQLRNANQLDQALVVMKEVKQLQSQIDMYKAQLSYLVATYPS